MPELMINKIEAWACTIPLGQALDFGAFQITERKHTVVGVSTTDGLVTELIGQSRGALVDMALLDVIAPLSQRIHNGYLHPSESPGSGIKLKPEMVAKFAVRNGKVEY